MNKFLELILIGISVGLGNFAASVAIGLSGVDKKLRLKIGLVFGLFETGMPIIGLFLGKQLSNTLGNHANLIGGGLLILTGLYEIRASYQYKKEEDTEVVSFKNNAKLPMAGLALSIDNLIIGFSLGTHKEPLLLSAFVLGATSVALSLIGLELGKRLGNKIEEYTELLSGLTILLVGLAVSFRVL
jgi:manganese efflux pump family protein